LLGTLSVRGLVCSIPADRHAAPATRMATGSIDEKELAFRALARFHVGEVFGADKVGERSCQGKEQRLG
jgi:hypothetical protein